MLMGQVLWSMLLLAYVFPALSAAWGARGALAFLCYGRLRPAAFGVAPALAATPE
ncbi:hypothetical protein ACV229_24215 [Burkholderia sp. MR1-5-21]